MSDLTRFALLGHPADYNHFIRLMEGESTGRRQRLARHERTFAKMVEWMPSYATAHRPKLRLDGVDLEGRLIVCPFFPERIASPQQMKRAHDKVVEGCRLAKKIGATVVALGGFTSIVEGAHGNSLAADLGLTITSGNSLTAALASVQLRAALAAAGRAIEHEPIAIIGATGDVGRACTQLLAPMAGSLILVARNRARLELLRSQVRAAVPMTIDVDPRAALLAGSVIAATSTAAPLIDIAELRPGSIICDVGFPKNLTDATASRDDVLIFSGGLAQLPDSIDLHSYTALPAPHLIHGCFCEGIVLAARPEFVSLAANQGDAEADRATALLELATGLGIRPAPLYAGGRLVDNHAVARMPRREIAIGL
jgi:fatty aldehyde-generating acyl-ACP reductase